MTQPIETAAKTSFVDPLVTSMMTMVLTLQAVKLACNQHMTQSDYNFRNISGLFVASKFCEEHKFTANDKALIGTFLIVNILAYFKRPHWTW